MASYAGGTVGGAGLTPIAGQTALANISGSIAVPSAATPAQMRTMLSVPGPSWYSTQLLTAQALLGSTLDFVIPQHAADYAGGPSHTGTLTYTGGGILVSTTGTASHVGSSVFRANGADTIFLPPSAGGKFYAAWSAKLNTAMDSAGNFRFGIGDGTDILNFILLGSTSTTTWCINGTRGGSAFTTLGTGGSATADTNPHIFAIYGDGTTYSFAIDSNVIGTSNALSAGPAGPCFMQIYANNGTTAAVRSLSMDMAIYCGVGFT